MHASCPYLATIDRSVLDFDFEKICSVTSSSTHVYACLVCGRYFVGRGRNSVAFSHSVTSDHHVFLNCENGTIYCLPELYEVIDSSVEDIRQNLCPVFTKQDVKQLGENANEAHALQGKFLQGFVGLNDISKSDWLNGTLQCLVHIPMLRDFFLLEENYAGYDSLLVKRFGEFMRKVWNPIRFKAHVSPHELFQAITLTSEKKFRPGVQSDPIQFLAWLLNKLHRDLGGGKKKESIISKCFQGELTIRTEKMIEVDEEVVENVAPLVDNSAFNLASIHEKQIGKRKPEDDIPGRLDAWGDIPDPVEAPNSSLRAKKKVIKNVVDSVKQPFFFLSLDLPNIPLFKDAVAGGSIIPQVPLFELLAKYNGSAEIQLDGSKKFYSISCMPKYLLLHFKRFVVNNFFLEKNSTIVNFPPKCLPFRECILFYFVSINADITNKFLSADEDLNVLTIAELRELLPKSAFRFHVEKSEIILEILEARKALTDPKYDLLASVVHTGKPDSGSYKAHVLCKPKDQWFEMENLHVSETIPQLVAVSEAYLQFYELQGAIKIN